MPDLSVVYEEDLEQVLKSVGKLEEVTGGLTKCIYCDEVVGQDNLYAIFPVDKNTVGFCCERPDCIENLVREHGLNTAISYA